MIPVDPALLGRNDLTADDLELLSDEVHAELWDGRLVRMPPELPIHQVVMSEIAAALDDQCPDEALSVYSLPIELDGRNVLRPDAALLRVEGAWRAPVLAEDVLLVAEVTSPWSDATDRGAKASRYATAGIANYWIVDIFAACASITVLRLGSDGRYRKALHTEELLALDEPWRVTLDLPDWTRQRDRIRNAASADRRGL